MLFYTYNCLWISDNPEKVLMELDNYFQFNPGSTLLPNIYLGGKFSKVVFTNGVEAYALSSSQYVQ